MKKRIISMIVCLMLLAAILLPASASGAENAAVVDAREGIARVFGIGQDGSTWVGTAFGVGTIGEPTDIFVTNRHCVLGEDEYGRTALASRIYLVLDGNSINYEFTGYFDVDGQLRAQSGSIDADTSRMVACDVLYYSPEYDIAVLKASRVVENRVALELADSAKNAFPSDTIYAMGYPGISDEVSNSSNWYYTGMYAWMSFGKADIYTKTLTRGSNVEDVTITSGTISRLTTMESANNTKAIQHNAQIHGGNSGGPLINSKGQVLGVNTWGVDYQASLNYAIYIDYVREILEDLDIEYNLGKVEETEPTEAPTEAVTTAPTEPATTQPTEPAPIIEDDDNTFIYVLIGVAAVAVIAVVAVILVTNQKKKKVVPPPVVQPPVRKPYVRSLAPQHGGMRVALQGQPILIGRSRMDCSIVFTENTPGVSSRHCSLGWDGHNFVLTDLHSSYGTFLQNGQKLAPDTPCRISSGTTFWLGDKKNVLRVELE